MGYMILDPPATDLTHTLQPLTDWDPHSYHKLEPTRCPLSVAFPLPFTLPYFFIFIYLKCGPPRNQGIKITMNAL